MALYIGGYYTSFIKTIVKDFIKTDMKVKPSIINKIFKNEKAYDKEINLDLVKAYRIHHLLFIPIGWERVFFLHNYEHDVSFNIDKDFHEALKRCKDDDNKYEEVIKKFLDGKLEKPEGDKHMLRNILIGIGIFILFVVAISLLAIFLG